MKQTTISRAGDGPSDKSRGSGDLTDERTNVQTDLLNRITLPSAPVAARRFARGSKGHFTGSLIVGSGAGWVMEVESHLEMQVALVLTTRAGVVELENQVPFRCGRFAWTLRVVRTCPVHGLALVERARKGWSDRFQELTFVVPERGDALRAMEVQATRRSVSPLQGYALSRLAGNVGPAWLDAQSLEQAVRATEMLGAVVAFGARCKVSEMTADEWDQAGRVGFAFTSRGDEGIREALSGLQTSFRKAGKQPVHRNVFGRLYEWLASKTAKEPGDIKRIVREHMFETIELPSGATILGGTLPERRLHSAASLARESGLYAPTLRNVLILQGLISREGAHHVFDANAGRPVAASVCEMVHVNTLPKVLNCSRYQALSLLDEQILMPIAVGVAGAPGRTQKAVASSSIRAFLSALVASAQAVDAVPPGWVPIAKAAEKAKTSRVDIVHLVLGGYLSNVIRLSSLTAMPPCMSIRPRWERSWTSICPAWLSRWPPQGCVCRSGPSGLSLKTVKVERFLGPSSSVARTAGTCSAGLCMTRSRGFRRPM